MGELIEVLDGQLMPAVNVEPPKLVVTSKKVKLQGTTSNWVELFSDDWKAVVWTYRDDAELKFVPMLPEVRWGLPRVCIKFEGRPRKRFLLAELVLTAAGLPREHQKDRPVCKDGNVLNVDLRNLCWDRWIEERGKLWRQDVTIVIEGE